MATSIEARAPRSVERPSGFARRTGAPVEHRIAREFARGPGLRLPIANKKRLEANPSRAGWVHTEVFATAIPAFFGSLFGIFMGVASLVDGSSSSEDRFWAKMEGLVLGEYSPPLHVLILQGKEISP